MKFERLEFRLHAVQRMFQRRISLANVRQVIEQGEVIENYPDDTPYPSCLVLGYTQGRPLHVVVANEVTKGRAIVVTVYEPDPRLWEPGFRRRRWVS